MAMSLAAALISAAAASAGAVKANARPHTADASAAAEGHYLMASASQWLPGCPIATEHMSLLHCLPGKASRQMIRWQNMGSTGRHAITRGDAWAAHVLLPLHRVVPGSTGLLAITSVGACAAQVLWLLHQVGPVQPGDKMQCLFIPACRLKTQ